MATARQEIIPGSAPYNWRKAPFGMKWYDNQGRTFDRLHRAGSMKITGSGVPNLFGEGFSTRFAYACHVRGDVPMDFVDTPLTERGRVLERIVLELYTERTGRQTRQIKAWGEHPELRDDQGQPFLYASPDGVVLDDRGHPAGPCEVKVVASHKFFERYKKGEKHNTPVPPLREMLQHQSQLEITGASSGPIIAWELGDYVSTLHHWEIERNQGTIDVILEEAEEFHKILRRGELPDPDFSAAADQAAISRLYKVAEGAEPIDLRGQADLTFALKEYLGATALRSQADKDAKRASAVIRHAVGEHPFALIGEKESPDPQREPFVRKINTSEVRKAETIIAAHTYRGLWISDPTKAKKAAKKG